MPGSSFGRLSASHAFQARYAGALTIPTAALPASGESDAVRVVSVGGGSAGCSLAYRLARRGVDGVTLLDKGELTSGSTWHAAGMVTHFHTSPTIMRMRAYSIGLYRSLQDEPGAVRHWREVGSLRVASSRDQLAFLERQVGMARALGLHVGPVRPAEAGGRFPRLPPPDTHRAVTQPAPLLPMQLQDSTRPAASFCGRDVKSAT